VKARADVVHLSLLRGVCQIPAYVAYDEGFFRDEGIEVDLSIAATAWLVPERMLRGEVQFAVIPWTRVLASAARGEPLVLVCGSGCEEAAVVVRRGLAPGDVRRVAIPQRGGMKDLTAVGLMRRLGWGEVETLRLPSGDGAILSFVGGGADAASMVEPYATMLEELQMGTVAARTRDVWPGAPGCSLTTTATVIERQPDLVQRVVRAFVRGARFAEREPERAAAVAGRHIGIAPRFIEAALGHNRPDVCALHHEEAMDRVISFMSEMGYLETRPDRAYKDLSFLDRAIAAPTV